VVSRNLEPLKSLDAVEQAVYFHSRERRKSLAGVPELHRTRLYPIPTSPVLATEFPDRDLLFAFWCAIRITDVAPAGLLFELGDATTAIAAWIDDDTVGFRAGDTADDAAVATFVNAPGTLPVGLELDLVFAVRPGDGRVRVWGNGQEIARATAVNGQLPNGFAAASNGAFAAAAVGALPADVTQTGAPSDFEVFQPLSVFRGQVPRHFI
jgi:hypothetical protein